MFNSKIKTLTAIFASILLGFSLIIGCAFFYGFPDHPINVSLFKALYRVSPSPNAFLEFYSPRRRDVSNGNIPKEVDEFLCYRIEIAESDELSAIINFYALQSGGREGNLIYKIPDQAKQKVIAQIISEFDSNKNLSGKMVLLEQLRLGKSLGKGVISHKNYLTPESLPIEKWREWKDENVAPRAKNDFRRWWDLSLNWNEKRRIDPLKDSEVKINECCG